jgi:site-specific recombinase XerD
MIHRQNYLDVHAYLRHMERKQLDPATVKRARGHLRHLLEWADETPLTKSRSIDPVFPAYLATARIANSPFQTKPLEQGLAPASIIKCLANTRAFFDFAHSEWTLRYKSITSSWIDLLQPPRHLRAESRLIIRQYWTLDQVRQVAAVSAETLREARGQVAVCMLFLSGMRAEALASLPIHCVDIPNNTLRQLPEAGVKTKNRKAAITYLLPIPDLLAVILRWDQRVRAHMSPASLWYANLSSDGMRLMETTYARNQRSATIEDDVKIICARANLPYLSPHKLRHGHTVYGLKHARTPAELKAVSQNIMHASMITTDGIYANLVSSDVQDVIASLVNKQTVPLIEGQLTKDQIAAKIAELLELLKAA